MLRKYVKRRIKY